MAGTCKEPTFSFLAVVNLYIRFLDERATAAAFRLSSLLSKLVRRVRTIM